VFYRVFNGQDISSLVSIVLNTGTELQLNSHGKLDLFRLT
jgi:hypothetical protein